MLKKVLRSIVLLLAAAAASCCENAATMPEAPSSTQAIPRAQNCACDPACPETLAARECGLCREAEKQPAGVLLFFLKDNHPGKPNRWLALPRAHGPGMHEIAHLDRHERAKFWEATIRKARALWGDQWGLAINGVGVRTQCHAHAHIGKLLERAAEQDTLLDAAGVLVPGNRPTIVNGPAEFPTPHAGHALWIHPQGSKFHVHVEDRSRATEFVLMR